MKIRIYSMGPFCCSVCAPVEFSREEVEMEVNRAAPAGTQNGWRISEDAHFRQGQPNPCPCEQVAGRLHYLMNC